jgi:hypothetical protein
MSANSKIEAVLEHRKKKQEQQKLHKDMIDEVYSLFDFSHLTDSSKKHFSVEYDDEMTKRYKVGTVISVFSHACRYKPEFDKGDYDYFGYGELPPDFLNYNKMKELGYECECQSDSWWIFYKTKEKVTMDPEISELN